MPVARTNTRLQTWVKAHPWGWAVVSGLIFAVVGLGLDIALLIVVPISVAFGLVNGWIWRPGGPAHSWNARIERRFPQKPA
jgi:hypothetical protein